MAEKVCLGGKASTCILEVEGLNLGWDTDYPDFFVLLPSPSGQMA
jgi:hypothetical protein